jgi:hypothetical protein
MVAGGSGGCGGQKEEARMGWGNFSANYFRIDRYGAPFGHATHVCRGRVGSFSDPLKKIRVARFTGSNRH